MKELVLKGLNEKIYEHETKDGLKVYMWVNDKVNSMYCTLSVKYGSIHTKFKVNNKIYEVPDGIAHFLEHVNFNVSDEVTAHELFAESNGDANAFTTFDYTSYLFFATKNKIKNLNNLLDFVYTPAFSAKMIKKEKGIILEEANMGEDDNQNVFFYRTLENVFQKSKYRNLVVGKPSDIKKITLKDVKLVYDTFYHPKNMFLCITGNFDPYEVVQVVENNLANKTFPSYKYPEVINENEPKKVNREYDEYYEFVTYPKVRYTIKLATSKFKDYSLIELRMILNLILNINFGTTSDFAEEVKDKKLVTEIYYGVDLCDDYVLLNVSAISKYPEEIINKIKEKMNNLTCTEKDVTRKKNATIATLILDYDDIEVVNSILQDDILLEGCIVTDMKERLTKLDMDSLNKVINKITMEYASTTVFLPKENQEN